MGERRHGLPHISECWYMTLPRVLLVARETTCFSHSKVEGLMKYSNMVSPSPRSGSTLFLSGSRNHWSNLTLP